MCWETGSVPGRQGSRPCSSGGLRLEPLKVSSSLGPKAFWPTCLSGIRDVSKWSERTRKPLEALYGFDYFARTCEKWVDGIVQFKRLPEGKSHGLLHGPLLVKDAVRASPDPRRPTRSPARRPCTLTWDRMPVTVGEATCLAPETHRVCKGSRC